MTFSKGGTPICKVETLFPFIKETVNFALSGSNIIGQFDIQQDLRNCNIDKNQIGQVIDNIIINASQAMPLGGQIDLRAKNVSLKDGEHALLVAGEYVKITIKDYGIGIPPQMLTRIFDPFFTTKPKGHGLGLATCYSIVKKHGGCIDVESEQGTGSTFHIYLPATAEAENSMVTKSTRSFHGAGTFVVMDDEEIIRDTIGAILKRIQFKVVFKNNGQDMLEFLTDEIKANRKIAGMIFDLTIPGAMGGKEAIKEVRKLKLDIPVFVSSGYAEDPVMANPTEYGFTASIAKPFRVSELIDMLSKYMEPLK
ncbi:MAG: response regulator [Spirochaetales bacterium]|nr:response regulator [Spirochaetales bacterium]